MEDGMVKELSLPLMEVSMKGNIKMIGSGMEHNTTKTEKSKESM